MTTEADSSPSSKLSAFSSKMDTDPNAPFDLSPGVVKKVGQKSMELPNTLPLMQMNSTITSQPLKVIWEARN
jgi:hypothetical protein